MNSASAGAGNTRPRPRPILSCLECRRKKLKCDRNQPCNQCHKIGRPDHCSFSHPTTGQAFRHGHATNSESGIDEGQQEAFDTGRTSSDIGAAQYDGHNTSGIKRQRTQNHSGDLTDVKLGMFADLQSRVRNLERLLGEEDTGPRPGPGSEIHRLYSTNIGDTGPSIHGHNHRSTLLRPFEEARRFLHDFPNDLMLKPYIQKITRMQKVQAVKLQSPVARQDQADQLDTFSSMLAVLPDRDSCNRLVSTYSSQAENTNRCLHLPSFFNQYHRYWESGQREAAFGFVPQLLVVIAITMDPDKPASNTEGLPRKDALIAVVDKWHAGLKRKDRLTIAALQVKLLVTLASHNIFLPSDRTWNATGSLVRYAMCLGLHMDSGYYKEISVFEGEIRRRLWATVLEIDLQASLVYGMPTALRADDWNTGPPSNLNDEELTEDLAELPVPHTKEKWTSALLQVVLASSLRQRYRTAAFINRIASPAPVDERHIHGKAIEQSLRDIPSVARAEALRQHDRDKSRSASDEFGCVLLDINIRRLLLYLYRPLALRTDAGDTFFRARRVCRDSALVILSHQDTFTPHRSDLETADTDDAWSLFDSYGRHDVLTAAMTICWEIRMMSGDTNRGAPNKPHRSDGSSDEAESVPWTRARLIRIVEDAFQALVNRLDKPGGFLKDLIGLAVVLQSVKSSGSQQHKDDMMRKGAIDVFETFLQRNNHQADTPRRGSQSLEKPGSYQGSTSDNGVLYQNGFTNIGDNYSFDMPNGDLNMENFDFTFPSDWNLF